MNLRRFYVYVLFRPWDGTPCYVGKGTGNRWLTNADDGKYNRHLGFVVQKAKALGMEIPRVKVRDGLSESDAYDTEIAFISAIGRGKDGPLVNLTGGGDGVRGPSDETRTKLRAAALKRSGTSEFRARMSALHKGKKISPETRAAMSAGHKGKPKSSAWVESHRAAMKKNIGSIFSEDTRAKMRAAAKLKKRKGFYPEHHKDAIRTGVAAYWQRRREANLPLKHPRRT